MSSPRSRLGLAVVLLGSTVVLACSEPTGSTPQNKLVFQVVANQTARTAFAAPVKVEIQDASGSVVTTATNSVTIALGTNPGTILWHASGCCIGPINAVLETVDPGSPAVIAGPVVTTTSEITALVYDPVNNILLGVDRSDSLITINTATGAHTLIGETGIGLAGGDYATGIAYESGATPRLLAVALLGDLFYSINRTTGVATSLGAMTLAGETILGGTGLATDPTTGTIYGILKLASLVNPARALVTINPTTRVVTKIGTLGETGMADLAFSAAGTLYGVTGDGGANSETLYTINKTTGATTLVLHLGNGSDGEAIASVQAALLGTVTVPAVAGVATFPGLQINAAANGYTLAASATALTAGTSAVFNVVAP